MKPINISNEAGSIGKRYRRGDEIGIPFAVTIDDNSIEKGIVTVRNRDTMDQKQVKIDELPSYIFDMVNSDKM